MWEMKEIRELKEGRYVNIDESPCKVVSISMSKPGKHGSAKASIVAVDIFTGAKKSINGPVTERVQVPQIDKRKGQILSFTGTGDTGDEIQIMDMETYETVTFVINEDRTSKVEAGAEILYISAMNKLKLL